jgi:8-oxo-dGTP pyrophosphatase MutT (NUDIX family)
MRTLDRKLSGRPMAHDIDVTVAAVIEREGRFLLVEERCAGRLVLNQPAGHLEHGESLLAAVTREALEETGHRFTPHQVVGFYLWRSDSGTTFLRVAFAGTAEPPQGVAKLDDGIVAVHWLSRDQIVKRAAHLRSPTVLRCLDDYLAGRRYPLDCLTYLEPETLARTQAAHG